ncbi:hypothetical protein IWQ60_004981 [Tieghemiomyces parasiticus]|uniref:Uncharacterized protein n=1 Tax=Tieghemiomyces parasiticus TaxID=78921 RepID=A0A9W8AEX5_9FUNG|nr:hypothetical protein IWQ60_004981 [Tieghemiomyces parasiticus]
MSQVPDAVQLVCEEPPSMSFPDLDANHPPAVTGLPPPSPLAVVDEDEDDPLPVAALEALAADPETREALRSPLIQDLVGKILRDPQPLSLLAAAVVDWPEFDRFKERLLAILAEYLPSKETTR